MDTCLNYLVGGVFPKVFSKFCLLEVLLEYINYKEKLMFYKVVVKIDSHLGYFIDVFQDGPKGFGIRIVRMVYLYLKDASEYLGLISFEQHPSFTDRTILKDICEMS